VNFRIGDLARRSGLTVRTQRHYDQIRLLTPAGRTDSGQRLYSEPDLRTLLNVLAQNLKFLDLNSRLFPSRGWAES